MSEIIERRPVSFGRAVRAGALTATADAPPLAPPIEAPVASRNGRPASMQWFDRLFLGSAALQIAVTVVSLPKLEKVIDTDANLRSLPFEYELLLKMLLGGLMIVLTIWYLVARLRLNFVRWLLTLFVGTSALGMLVQFPATFENYGAAVTAGMLLSHVTNAAAIAMLFAPASNDWFKRR